MARSNGSDIKSRSAIHALRDIIFISLENWDDIWRRNQFVCAEFLRRHPLARILFVGLAKDVSRAIRTVNLKPLFEPSTYFIPGFDRLTVTHSLKLLPNSLTVGRRINEVAFRRHVCRRAKHLGFYNPLLWINSHAAWHMVGRMNESASIYDVTDDWTTLTQSPREVRLIKQQDAELCHRASATIVCSERLYQMKRPLVRDLFLVPNGVNAEHYAAVRAGSTAPPPETLAWKRPVLGYTGTIHPDRIDVGLVAHLAKAHEGSVVLIGPNHLSQVDRATLGAFSNLHMLPAVPYADIPRYMSAFDVCITPHRMTPFTESLNPIKLWEYLAAGLPIVSTDVAGFRDYPQLVHLARTPEAFVAASRRALREGDVSASRRREEAARHSWARRVDMIEEVIAGCLSAGATT